MVNEALLPLTKRAEIAGLREARFSAEASQVRKLAERERAQLTLPGRSEASSDVNQPPSFEIAERR
jgi:hypothetical protein